MQIDCENKCGNFCNKILTRFEKCSFRIKATPCNRHKSKLSLLHCALICAVYCNRPCLFVCLFVGPLYCSQRAVFASPLNAVSLLLLLLL